MSKLLRKLSHLALNGKTAQPTLTRREHHIPGANNVKSESETKSKKDTTANSIFKDDNLKRYYLEQEQASERERERTTEREMESERASATVPVVDQMGEYASDTSSDEIQYLYKECNSSKVMLECGHIITVESFRQSVVLDVYYNVCNICGKTIESEDKYCLLSKCLKSSKMNIKNKKSDINRIELEIRETSLLLEELYNDYEELKNTETRIKSSMLNCQNVSQQY
jgi:hypothetical protein